MTKDRWTGLNNERVVPQRPIPGVVFLDPVTLKPVPRPLVVMQRYDRQDYATAWQKELGEKVRLAREAKGISQAELSRRSGLRQSHISLIELGSLDLRITTLFSLAHTLEVKADQLFPGGKPKPAPRRKGTRSKHVDAISKHITAIREMPVDKSEAEYSASRTRYGSSRTKK